WIRSARSCFAIFLARSRKWAARSSSIWTRRTRYAPALSRQLRRRLASVSLELRETSSDARSSVASSVSAIQLLGDNQEVRCNLVRLDSGARSNPLLAGKNVARPVGKVRLIGTRGRVDDASEVVPEQ